MERPDEVDVHRAAEFAQRGIKHRLEDRVPRIVHDRIETGEAFLNLPRGRLDLIGQGDVAGDPEHPFRRVKRGDAASERFAVDIEQRRAPAFGEKALRSRKPDAARSAGDDDCPGDCLGSHGMPSRKKARSVARPSSRHKVLDSVNRDAEPRRAVPWLFYPCQACSKLQRDDTML